MGRTFQEELRQFSGREEGLRRIARYHVYQPMFYRTSDWIHAIRVCRFVRALGPFVSQHVKAFDQSRAEAMALVHDDAELLIGDEQAGNKAKMKPRQLAALKRKEREAIDSLAERFPATLCGYAYRDLLLANFERKGPEAQLVQFCDKLDAFGEALHEIAAGNRRFASNVVTEYGTIDLPPVFYYDYFRRFAATFPSLAFLIEGSERVLDLDTCASVDWKVLAERGTPHTRDSLTQRTGLQPYDFWKEVLFRGANEEEINHLTVRVE